MKARETKDNREKKELQGTVKKLSKAPCRTWMRR